MRNFHFNTGVATINATQANQVRAQGEQAGHNTALEITDICSLAGRPEMAATYLRKGMSAAAVRKELMAQVDREEQMSPGSWNGTIEDNPLVKGATRLAAAQGLEVNGFDQRKLRDFSGAFR